ncbi:hypothetical protein [Nocardia farcinica]|uniref:hypothetical protein n=1 Tax=Nocardia farcinica TaxID=37329 RepID=UPI001895DCDC|nr:hypothetical protein [Nocardia farcinica]MBF6189437.1 hypothetical protein [Nocardia farcinica]MBF6291815.1 hypothetical protein [Nocardia farcinica]
MPKFADKVIVDLKAKKFIVDGEEFPYWLSEEGPKVDGLLQPNALRSVTVTFFTNDIEVIPEGKTEPADASP